MKDNTKHNSNKLGSIWLIVLLLIIMILASAALLGTLIKEYVGGEKNVIAVMLDGNAMKEQYDDDSLPAGANPDMSASWETETSVDLFKNTYVGADGTVTVQSANGDKVIAPGTSNDYEFTIKNTGNVAIDYTLVLDGVFQISDLDLPFYVRLRHGDTWIVGGENEWVHVDELNKVVEDATLERDKADTYRFEWMWPYEADDEANKLIGNLNDTLLAADANDTQIGSLTVDMKTDFHLNISVSSVVTPGAIPVYADGTPIMRDFLAVVISAGLILASGLWLILIFFRRKIYFTGIVEPAFSGEVKLGKKTSNTVNNRFIFPKARFGKRKLVIGEWEIKISFKSRRVKDGIRLDYKGEKTVIVVDRKVRAVELHFAMGTSIRWDKWAAIDKKHNVYTLGKITPPIDKCNTTPYGLSIDKDGKLFIGTNAEGLHNGKTQERETEKV